MHHQQYIDCKRTRLVAPIDIVIVPDETDFNQESHCSLQLKRSQMKGSRRQQDPTTKNSTWKNNELSSLKDFYNEVAPGLKRSKNAPSFSSHGIQKSSKNASWYTSSSACSSITMQQYGIVAGTRRKSVFQDTLDNSLLTECKNILLQERSLDMHSLQECLEEVENILSNDQTISH